MRLLAMLFAAAVIMSPAQQGTISDGGVTRVPRSDGGVSEVLQSIHIPAIPDAPFVATVHAEWVRQLGGGGTVTYVNQRTIVRDRNGRLFEERCALTPKKDAGKPILSMIQIYDPNKHTGYDCFVLGPRHGTCELRDFHPSAAPAEAAVVTGPIPGNLGFRQHEDLGTREIEGVETIGARDTITWKAGVMGNDEPMRIVREFWHSPQLGINLISILDDPRTGRQTFRLTNVSTGDVDPQYFRLPEGYRVDDRREQKDPSSN